jgi:hypothetical protein
MSSERAVGEASASIDVSAKADRECQWFDVRFVDFMV